MQHVPLSAAAAAAWGPTAYESLLELHTGRTHQVSYVTLLTNTTFSFRKLVCCGTHGIPTDVALLTEHVWARQSISDARNNSHDAFPSF